LAARVKLYGRDFVGEQRELQLVDEDESGENPYERLLHDAMAGKNALFTRQDAVEAAWSVVEPVLGDHRPAIPYAPSSWGPREADRLIAADGGWRNPDPRG